MFCKFTVRSTGSIIQLIPFHFLTKFVCLSRSHKWPVYLQAVKYFGLYIQPCNVPSISPTFTAARLLYVAAQNIHHSQYTLMITLIWPVFRKRPPKSGVYFFKSPLYSLTKSKGAKPKSPEGVLLPERIYVPKGQPHLTACHA